MVTLVLGSEAVCSDGYRGEVQAVALDPDGGAVTHLVVEPAGRSGLARLVPLDLVDTAADGVRLRCTEAEFQDLGVAKTQGGPRVYRRADVERVLRIKHLLFVEGLTLAGARRRMAEEKAPSAPDPDAFETLLSSDARERILSVRQSLRELSAMLSGKPVVSDAEFALAAPAPRVVKKPAARPAPAQASKARRKK